MKKALALIYINILIPIWIWNEHIFLFINAHYNPTTDILFGLISGLGYHWIAFFLCALVLLFHPRLGLTGLVASILAAALNQALKVIFDTPRPAALYEHLHLLGSVKLHHSFPSGHATACGVLACLALVLWKHQPKMAWFMVSLFVLAAYGRIYGGSHFPLDVLVGFTLGLLFMFYANMLSLRLNIEAQLAKAWVWYASASLLLVITIALNLPHQIEPSTAQPLALAFIPLALAALIYTWKKRFR